MFSSARLKQEIINRFWYGKNRMSWLLSPFSMVFKLFAGFRRWYLTTYRQRHFKVPIIVVGNITVGGVGKTPLVIALAKVLLSRGLRVGIVSRGYGSRVSSFPHEVSPQEDANLVGDEPLLIAKNTTCPVVIDPCRPDAVSYLLDHYNSDVIISDDGLQHYALGRTMEIVVVDSVRKFGNGFCLPAGPLREPISRLDEADIVVVNQALKTTEEPIVHGRKVFGMAFCPQDLIHLKTGKKVNLNTLVGPVAAIAGIGHPQRFFSMLEGLGLQFNAYSFDDHHHYLPGDFSQIEKCIVMTEKDAVKCQLWATDSMYFLPIDVSLDDEFWGVFWSHKQLQGFI